MEAHRRPERHRRVNRVAGHSAAARQQADRCRAAAQLPAKTSAVKLATLRPALRWQAEWLAAAAQVKPTVLDPRTLVRKAATRGSYSSLGRRRLEMDIVVRTIFATRGKADPAGSLFLPIRPLIYRGLEVEFPASG